MAVYFFSSCFWPKPPKAPVPLDALLPKPNALGVVDDVCPKIGCAPLEAGVVEVGAPKGEGAVELFVVEDDLLAPNEKVEL